MYIRRFSTLFDKYADYCISIKPIETCQHEAFTSPNHTFYEDIKLTDDIVIIRKAEVEGCLSIKLNGLEQTEI